MMKVEYLEIMVQELAHALHETTSLFSLFLLMLKPEMLPHFLQNLQLLLPVEPVVIVPLKDLLHPFVILVVITVAVLIVVVVQPHPPPANPRPFSVKYGVLEVAVLAGGNDHIIPEGDLVDFPQRGVNSKVVAAGTF